jgi:hypothetical protein
LNQQLEVVLERTPVHAKKAAAPPQRVFHRFQ